MSLRACYVPTCRSQRLLANYAFSKQLGEGVKGRVMQVTHKASGVDYAVKILPKYAAGDLAVEEASIMRSLDHVNVVSLYEMFEDDDSIYLLVEHCQGGELMDLMVTHKKLDEPTAAIVMRQLLRVVRHLQRRRVCHSDISMVNLLCVNSDPITRHNATSLRLIDFGSAFRLWEADLRDLQSCGRILGTLLHGQGGQNDISSEAKALMKMLIAADPENRPTAKQALRHEWFQKYLPRQSKRCARVPRGLIGCLRDFSSQTALRKSASIVMAEKMKAEDLRTLRDGFSAMDGNGDGVLTPDEVAASLKRAGIEVPDDLAHILKSVDPDNVGVLEFSAFLAAMVDHKHLTDEDYCQVAFRVFDEDNNGLLSKGEALTLLLDKDIGFALNPLEAGQYLDSIEEEMIDLESFLADRPDCSNLCLKYGSMKDPDIADMNFQPFRRNRGITGGDNTQALLKKERSCVIASKLAAVTPRQYLVNVSSRFGEKDSLQGFRSPTGQSKVSDIANLEDLLDEICESSSDPEDSNGRGELRDAFPTDYCSSSKGSEPGKSAVGRGPLHTPSTAYFSSASGQSQHSSENSRPITLFTL